MSELFVAYKGKWLTVSEAYDHYLQRVFPEINLQQEYKLMDLWLENLRPSKRWRNQPKGIANWLKKELRNRPKVAAELKVGQAPRPSAKTHVKEAVLNRWRRNAKV